MKFFSHFKKSSTITHLTFLILALFGIYALWQQEWSSLFIVVIGIGISLIPYFLESRFQIQISDLFKGGVVLFVFASLVLGSLNNFYEKFWWWDILLHTWAGFGFTLIAYTILASIYKKSNLVSTSLLTSIFAFSFSMAVLVLWEVFEFTVDQTTGSRMQPSLFDTMTDLIVGLVGAVMATLYGWRFIRKRNKSGDKITSALEVTATNE